MLLVFFSTLADQHWLGQNGKWVKYIWLFCANCMHTLKKLSLLLSAPCWSYLPSNRNAPAVHHTATFPCKWISFFFTPYGRKCKTTWQPEFILSSFPHCPSRQHSGPPLLCEHIYPAFSFPERKRKKKEQERKEGEMTKSIHLLFHLHLHFLMPSTRSVSLPGPFSL